MIPKFNIGDLVQYEMYDFPTEVWGLDVENVIVQAVITGFYDQETGEKLSADFTTHDKVIEASVISNYGNTRVMLHDLELLSPAEVERC